MDDVEIPSLIVDRNGQEIGRVFVENRSVVPRTAIPENMIKALIAGEDQRFLRHDGVDYVGIVRAFYLNFKSGRRTQGASTLTQQLARNAFNLKDEADKRGQGSYERKLVEAFLAQRIEKRYSKSEILTFYLNRIPFGSGFYGIRSASLGYFGKEPGQLTVEECASLVGSIKNPSRFSALRNPKNNKKSRNNVLRRMVDEGFLDAAEAEKLKKEPVVVDSKPLQRGTSHFYGRVLAEIRQLRGEEFLTAGGYKIYTTIDSTLQNAAERRLSEQLAAIEERPDFTADKYESFTPGTTPKYLQGAVLVTDNRSGEVLAYVGGRNYAHSQYDFIAEGARPLGTAYLPFVYATAYEKNFSPVSLVLDDAMDNRTVMVGGTEGILAEWGMESAEPRYEGNITARQALAQSKIAASVRLGTDVGLESVMQTAERFGLEHSEGRVLPRVLLGWDAASLPQVNAAYGTFANLGARPPEFSVLRRIENSAGEVIYRTPPPASGERALDQATAYQVHSSLAATTEENGNLGDVSEDFTLNGVLKTGTNHTFTDNWAIGYTQNLTCSVWTGFLDSGTREIYEFAFAKDTILPVARGLIETASLQESAPIFDVPKGLEPVEVCSVSGGLATRFCYEDVYDEESGATMSVSTTYTEFLKERKDSLSYCTVHGEGVSGLAKLLEDFAPDRAPEDVKAVLAVPIRPQALPLVGEDPYRSKMPNLVAAEDYEFPTNGLTQFLFDGSVPGADQAQLRLRVPPKMRIHLD